jgi:SsrA-binding protein
VTGKPGSKRGAKRGEPEGVKVIATNRKARFDFAIEDSYEAGLSLMGSEVKSIRAGNVNLSDSYAQPKRGELYLVNCRVGEYDPAAHFGHAPLRERKLLMKRAEIDKIAGKVEKKGYTLVPLSLYFKDGWAKVEIGLARGKTHGDRRHTIAEREQRREMDRALSRKRR